MGKSEKLVVLAVLFTAALVLALAFNRGGKEAEASDPLSGAQRVLDLGTDVGGATGARETEAEPALDAPSTAGEQPAQEPTSAGATGPESHGSEQAPSLLLNAGKESELVPDDARFGAGQSGAKLTLEPESDQSRRILMETRGLRPSFLEDYWMYTIAEGDTWSSLAQRFYQDGRYTRNLHLANEDLEELTPGKDILVPVFDFLAADAGLRPGADAPAFTARPADDGAPAESIPSSVAGTRPAADSTRAGKLLEYEVRSGDTLSDISLAVFGTATRWKEILEANRDKLQRPESLQVGMKLKIPEGGKLPAAVKKPETKTKPATAEKNDKANKSAATTTAKKKKVL
jgi:nucleoid-associated protein YgaU